VLLDLYCCEVHRHWQQLLQQQVAQQQQHQQQQQMAGPACWGLPASTAHRCSHAASPPHLVPLLLCCVLLAAPGTPLRVWLLLQCRLNLAAAGPLHDAFY
jgi:hypothetical protein